MTHGWNALDAELEHWTAQDLRLPLWWRDDDAIAPSDALVRLEALATQLDLPVHLAVIPEGAVADLVTSVQQSSHLVPVVHGWAHQNHAGAAKKKCEFPSTRPVDQALADAEDGMERLKQLFGTSLQPMFVPPWNRISPAMLPWLAGLGFAALSTYGTRKRVQAAPGLMQINTHVDPIDWKGSRGLAAEDEILARLVAHLEARRAGTQDRAEPLGLLTHHLVHDDQVWEFCETLLTRLLAGPAHPWRFNERIS
ncbi:polysaccharide deacetylase family protein [Tritonibacter scottomollicae]|uniref:polysaccharide deacetylase family protein n=1 Tax=Tritonibacter scottomollicae TaxID=483013 RepID=UPI003AA8EA39